MLWELGTRKQMIFVAQAEICLMSALRPDLVDKSLANFVRLVLGTDEFNASVEMGLEDAIAMSTYDKPIVVLEHPSNASLHSYLQS